MQLKREMERISCDFCHRRKIKCDRSSRLSCGHDGCSPCAVRQAPCRLDESDDIRIRRRRQRNARGRLVGDGPQHQHTAVADVAHRIQDDLGVTAPYSRQDGLVGNQSADTSVSPTQEPNTSSAAGGDTGLLFLDDPFGLSLEGSNILGQIFMWDSALPANPGLGQDLGDDAMDDFDGNPTPIPRSDAVAGTGGYREQFLVTSDMNSVTFTDALQAYFKFAAVSLPIIFEDAFWQDYQAGRCSRSLVFAIACRGMPFSSASDKWEMQQRLACSFRDALFEAQARTNGLELSRTDDLEALALMIGFVYKDSSSIPLHAHLERLLLTHDSLILMTLRFGRQNPATQRLDGSETLARADERRTLLFWHVFGLDAFHTLDSKGLSHISDQEVDLVPDFLKHVSGGYLDAILALAVIARRIMQTLCTVTTRRKGIRSEDVLSLYAQLDNWRQIACPLHLRREGDKERQVATEEEEGHSGLSEPSIQLQLHRALVWLLETNCYMQIESLVADIGLKDESHFAAETCALRVDCETMRAVQDVVVVASWMGQRQKQGQDDSKHSLVDLSPILRSICAGICVWTCVRGQDLQNFTSTCRLRAGPLYLKETTRGSCPNKERLVKYREMAIRLRDAVATATSHQDTQQLVQNLDQQLLSLNSIGKSS